MGNSVSWVWVWLAAMLVVAAPQVVSAQALRGVWLHGNRAPSPPNGPGAGGWMKITYDPVNQKTVVIGGSGSNYYNDVWWYDAGLDTWASVEPYVACKDIKGFTPPVERDEHVVDYDPEGRLYWMYGGTGFGCKGPSRVAGVGTTPNLLVDPGLPETTPDAYKDWTVQVLVGGKAYIDAYDPATKSLTLATPIAGLASGVAYYVYPQRGGGTFFYDPGMRTWRGLDGPHWGYSGALPINRVSPAFAYSSRDRALVMFGGGGRNDTWALDVLSQTWVRMLGDDTPGSAPRMAQLQNAMVYDSGNDLFVLFGGICRSTLQCGTYDAETNETWVYSLATNTWTKRIPPVSPPPRQQPQMAYDPVHRLTVLYGGRRGSEVYDDLWVYDVATNTWTEVQQFGSLPGPVRLGSMTYDAAQQVLVLYHGHKVHTMRLELGEPGNPPPLLDLVSPNSAPAGAPNLLVTVTGRDFVSGAVVRWNGSDRATAFVNATTLRATIPASDLAAPAIIQVTVVNPSPGGGTSNPLPFGVGGAAKDLLVDAITVSPTALFAGDPTVVTYTVRNQGVLAITEDYVDQMFFSTRSGLDGEARLIKQTVPRTVDLPTGGARSYTQLLSIPSAAAPGGAYVLVKVDAAGAVSEGQKTNNVMAVPITVFPAPAVQVIVDNAPAGTQDEAGGRTFTGTWCTAGSGGNYGTWSLRSCGEGVDSYRWTPTLPISGSYDVYVRWTSTSLHATRVPIVVSHSGGITTREFNQRNGGGIWQLHGRYSFGAGSSGFVEVNDVNGEASADAVRFVKVE